jgi:hypothetical protein
MCAHCNDKPTRRRFDITSRRDPANVLCSTIGFIVVSSAAVVTFTNNTSGTLSDDFAGAGTVLRWVLVWQLQAPTTRIPLVMKSVFSQSRCSSIEFQYCR